MGNTCAVWYKFNDDDVVSGYENFVPTPFTEKNALEKCMSFRHCDFHPRLRLSGIF